MNKKKILIVNCYFDELRIPIRRTAKIQAMAPVFLAGMFSPKRCDIRLYNEQYSGPLEDPGLLSWPDLLVLSGLNTAFDRMLHLTAYVKTKNKKTIVAAGGPAMRALPRYANRFFDFVCCGDIEQLQEVIQESFGREYVSEEFLKNGWALPRYDLAYWSKNIIYVESSRNCYFRCSFCSLTGEKGQYRMYNLKYIKQQFLQAGEKWGLFFLDNNFASPNRKFVEERFELIREFEDRKYFSRWGALVSNEFFDQEENIDLLRQSKCQSLFSGLESFDRDSLKVWRKYQNMKLPQMEIIRRCLDAGVSFHYGLIFDLTTRSVREILEEIEFILDNPEITLPCFTTLAIPILGTPYFYDCLAQNKFLPRIKLRDLDGTTLVMKTVDPLPAAAKFVKDIQGLSSFHNRVLKHALRFLKHNRKVLPISNMVSALYNHLSLCAPNLMTAPSVAFRNPRFCLGLPARTHIGTTEPLDPVYTPAFRIDSRYDKYFKPTMLTDSRGALNEELREDIQNIAAPENEKQIVPEAVHAAC